MLHLGDADLSADAVLYVRHACENLSPFGLSVDYRGELGEDLADVLFFEDNAWDLKRVKEFRHWLLLNDEIKRAYDAADQFPEWMPHLTLGYPEAPARKLDDEDHRIGYVQFDRIAVWTDDFEGPTFRLKYDDSAMAEVAMGEAAAAELFHYGKKGMKWGVVTEENGTASASGTRPVALTEAENKADPDGPDRRALVKKAALIAGGVALTAGVAYGVHKYGQGSGSSNSRPTEAPKKEIQEPTSLIYLARAKNKGLTFHATGDTPDYFTVFDKMGLNGEVPNDTVVKDGSGNVGARLLDPLGRRDFAGRPIGHDFLIPKTMAAGIDTIDDVREKIWPKVSDQYQKFWDENLESKPRYQEEVAMSDISAVQRGETAVAELFHYGKKGMKWGVRNDNGHEGERVKTKKLEKMDKKWEAANTGREGSMAAYNAAAEKMNNGGIDKLNNKPEWKKAADEGKFEDWDNPSPELIDYMNDYTSTFNRYIAEAHTRLGKNPSGTKEFVVKTDEDGQAYAELVAIKHAEGDSSVRYKLARNEKGLITSFTAEEVELKHYGVKGMRWGVRKDEATSRGGASSGPTSVVVEQKKPGTYAKAKGGQGHPIHDDAKTALEARQKAKASTTDSLSNVELRKAVERMNLEKQYSQLQFESDRRGKGRRFVAGLFGQKRYTGEKRRFTDTYEDVGGETADIIKKILNEQTAVA